VIKLKRMRWAVHVAYMGDGRGVYRISLGDLKGRDHWKDLGIGTRITLGWTLGK
jgi:hypothetical protein